MKQWDRNQKFSLVLYPIEQHTFVEHQLYFFFYIPSLFHTKSNLRNQLLFVVVYFKYDSSGEHVDDVPRFIFFQLKVHLKSSIATTD